MSLKPINLDTSIRGAQTNITQLIERLEEENKESVQVYDELQNIENSTAGVFDIFQSNLLEMQNEFVEVLDTFKNGTMTPSNFEKFLNQEHKKGKFSLQLAEDLKNYIDKIFNSIYHSFII